MKKPHKNLSSFLMLILLLLLFVPINSFSAVPGSFKFDHIDVKDGLSASTVTAITRDSEGFLWVGTSNGLNRYNGLDFITYRYDRDDPNSISSNGINVLYEDSKKNLWVGTNSSGLNRLDKATGIFTRYQHNPGDENSLSDNAVMAIFEDNNGILWVGTDSGGLNWYDPTTGSFIKLAGDSDAAEVLARTGIYSIIEDRNGDIWIGTTSSGLFKYMSNTKTFKQYKQLPDDPSSISSNSVWAVFEDSRSDLWVGTIMGGLNKFNRETETFQSYRANPENKRSISSDLVCSIQEDQNGMLWIGTMGGGINYFDPVQETFYPYQHDPANKNSLSDDVVLANYVDKEGILWVGTNYGGLNKHIPIAGNFGHFANTPTNPASLSGSNVSSLFQDRRGILWVGTRDGGLNRMDPQQEGFSHYRYSDNESGVSTNDITAVTEDKDGRIWIGTWGGGLNILNPDTGKMVYHVNDQNDENSISSNHIRTLFKDSQDVIWIGTPSHGLNRYDGEGRFKRFLHDPQYSFSISNNHVRSIFEDSHRDLWFGTTDGLNRLDRKTMQFTRYLSSDSDSNSLSNDFINCIYEDSDGVLWVGTNEGINRFNRIENSFSYLSVQDGLAGNYVYAILEDEDKNLWISTDNGISRLDSARETFINYDADYGLQSNVFNYNAYYKNPSGELFFGGVNGFNRFHPDEIVANDYVPEIKITNITKYNRRENLETELDANAPIKLPYFENTISFAFTSDSFTVPEANEFAYMLEGYDTDWIYAGNKNTATYTNLDGGKYIFRVKGSNNDGVWNEQGTSVTIQIANPSWKTWWAYALYSLALAGLVTIYVQLRLRKDKKEIEAQKRIVHRLEQLDKLKDDFLARVTHELRTPVHGIIGIADSMSKGSAGKLNDNQQYNLTLIAQSARRLSSLINDILDFSKLKHMDIQLKIIRIDLHQVVTLILELLKPVAQEKGVALTNDIPNDFPTVTADELRLYQILFNLIGNAIKFTSSGAVEVFACRQNNGAVITVKDTGIGIPEENQNTIFNAYEQIDNSMTKEYEGMGLGLNITKNLVELHGGVIEVKSEVGKGTSFTFTIPDREVHSDETEKRNYPQLMQVPVDQKELKRLSLKHGKNTEIAPKKDNENAPHILIADDELANRQILVNYFSLYGYSVTSVSNGTEALEALEKSQKYDLAILDVMMPKMSGYDVCKAIRKKYSLYELPVIMLTIRNKPHDLALGFDAGANDYLTKPFDDTELKARVDALLTLKQSVYKAMTAEVCFLQAQIKPHFLHNTLNTIMSLCRTDVEKARSLIAELSHFLRKSFDFSDMKELTPIDEELSLVQSYVAIEKARYGERLKVQFDRDNEVQCFVPPFIIQPLVENAIKHAIAPRVDGGTVSISIKNRSGQVIIRVADDGEGMEKSQVDFVQNNYGELKRVGLKNIYQRMHFLYGYGPEIESEPGKGTVVTIKINKQLGWEHDQSHSVG